MEQQETEIDVEDSDRNPIDVLAEQFTDECRAGLRPSVEDYASRHPQLADRIRSLFPSIQAIEQLGSHAESEKRFAKANAHFDRNQIEQIGDYRIVREIGRGGMGIVYEAIQQSLGRHVAIKLLLQTSTSPTHLQRFEREARTAANLHHTNIVQVFGVGSQDGFHYYVMQLIDGIGLDRVIDELRQLDPESNADKNLRTHKAFASDYRNVAQIGRSVAEALQHAHDQGTLHRDIKPANLLLDAEGGIWVTDFGLAKAMEDSDVSRTGEVIGTLRFMAPEQFAGNPDPRSDVYSLGLSIYELLTLKPAWDESSRSHLLSGANSRKQSRIVPPMVHDSNIPRDLETIVLKACALDPDDRYQSAGALAEDLENYLEGRPINARPPYSFEVFAKWCRRNPAIAALSGLAALLLTLVAVSTSIGYFRTNAALKREYEERTRTELAKREADREKIKADAEKQKAERTLGISLKALDRIYNRFVPDRIHSVSDATLEGVDGEQLAVSSQATLSKETAALLEDVLSFYDEFAHQDSDSVVLKREAAKANRRVGDIHRQMGNHEKSIHAYDNAVRMYEDIGDSDLEVARIQTDLGNVFRDTREMDLSTAAFYHSRRLLEGIYKANPDSAEAKYELARTLYLLARRRPPDPEKQRADGPRPGGNNRNPRRDLGGPPRPRDSGGPPSRGERWDDGPRRRGPDGPPPLRNMAELSRSIELLEELRSEGSENPEHQFLLALCYRERDIGPGVHGQESIELLEDLCKRYPQFPDYQFELAETLSRVPVHGTTYSEASESAQRLEEALTWLSSLVDNHPNIPEYRKTKAHAHHKLGTILKHAAETAPAGGNEMEKALLNLRGAVESQLEIHKQFPESAADLLWLARMRENLAECLLQDNQAEAALRLIEKSIADSSQLPTDGNDEAAVLHTLVIQHRAWAEILETLGRDDEAAAARDMTAELHDRLQAIN